MALCERVDLLPGADVRAFIDIDSLLRPVYGHAKQGASYGHTKIAGKQILRKGLSPLVTTISTETGAPVIAGARLRAGRAISGKGAARMVAQAIATARAAGVTGQILVRGDSAYGTGVVIAACRRAGAQFSLVLTKNPAVTAAIAAIDEDAWTPVRYPGAVRDPDTGEWISDAEVAEILYTAFASTRHAGDRAVDRAPRQRRPLPRRPVPGVALSPVLHRHRRDRPLPPISPTAATPSSKPSSPTSSTGRWRICPRGASARTRPGSCARRSRTTCCAPPAYWPAAATHRRPRGHPAPAHRQHPRPTGPPAATTRPAPTQHIGPGHKHGPICGATPSAPGTHHRNPSPPDQPPQGPRPDHTGKAGQTSRYLLPTTRNHRTTRPRQLHRQLIGRSRLNSTDPQLLKTTQRHEGRGR